MSRPRPPRHLSVHALLWLASALALLPLAYLVSLSLSGGGALGLDFELIPRGLSLEHFQGLLADEPFLAWLCTSLELALLSVACCLGLALPGAYAFSRWKSRGQRGVLFWLLVLNAFPTVLSMVGIYRLFRQLGLMDQPAALALVYTGMTLVFAVWNLKGHLDGLDPSCEEAAALDGCPPLATLLRVVCPQILPALFGTGFLVFITAWNEYIYAINFLGDRAHYSLAAGLYALQGTEYTRNWPRFAAGSLLVTLPLMALAFAAQRHLAAPPPRRPGR